MARFSVPMRFARAGAALGLALLVATVPGADAAAPAKLARSTMITGSSSASVAVVLTRPGSLLIEPGTAQSPNVAVTGHGRVAGFDLRLDDGSAAPPHLVALLTNGCYTRACKQREHGVATYAAGFRRAEVRPGVFRYTLPAGRYRLMLIADGAPVTVRLRLDGLSGATALRPTGRAAVMWDPLKPNLTAGPEPATFVYSAYAGALPVGDRGGMLFTVFDVRLSAGDFGERGFCYYPGTTAVRVYVAACPGAQGSSGQSITGPIVGKHMLRGIQFLDGAAAANVGSVGVYYDNIGVLESIDALSVRIAY